METIVTETEINSNAQDVEDYPKLVAPQAEPRKYRVLYITVVIFIYGHLAALYGLYLACTAALWKTLVFSDKRAGYFFAQRISLAIQRGKAASILGTIPRGHDFYSLAYIIIYILAGFGISAGAHRLWCHRAYKATTPLQILLMLMNSMAYQNTAFDWVKKHRMHHRYSDTDADPYNATRGFFFSHMGWLLAKRHPDVKLRENLIDLSDLYANPVLMFQKRYAIPMIGTMCFVLPTFIPVYFFSETLNIAWNINLLRYVLNLHMSFTVNSLAHRWGNRPYEKSIKSIQSPTISIIAFGEGFHNYHHAFPWDYRAAELGNNWLNLTSLFITFFAWIGWAYDLKTVPESLVRSRMGRTGDGTNKWGFDTTEANCYAYPTLNCILL